MHFLLKGNPTISAALASLLALATFFAAFIAVEPVVTHGQETFTVRQQITSEISFLTAPNDVVMDDTIAGLTGGTAYGTTTFNITTNNPNGYTVTLAFATTTAMQGENINSDVPNYVPAVGGTPDYDFSISAGEAGFAYTVANETTPGDIDSTFKDNGAACAAGTNTTAAKCWFNKADATAAEQIIDSSNATVATGATSTVTFVVGVGLNPDPALETGWYNATATLTATVK